MARTAPPTPAQRITRQSLTIAASLCALGAFCAFTSNAIFGMLLLALGGWVGYAGIRLRREGDVAQRVNAALDHLTRGHVDEAATMLDAIPVASLKRQLRRAVAIQRSMIAMRRDDLAGCVEQATLAIDGGYGVVPNLNEKLQEPLALAQRAVANAGRGDAAAVHADVERILDSKFAGADAFARAALAQAIVLSREDRRAELASHLARNRKALLELTSPRDRVLVRALQRSLILTPGSAYREPARRDEPAPEHPLAGWVASVVPATKGAPLTGGAMANVAEHVGVGAPLPSARAAAMTMKKRARTDPRVLLYALPGLLLLLVLAVAVTLMEPLSQRGAPDLRVMAPCAFGVIFAIMLGSGFFGRLRGERLTLRMIAAGRLYAADDSAPAVQAFAVLSNSTANVIGAKALNALAQIRARAGDFATAVTLCDRAVGRVAENLIAAHVTLPTIQTQRAYCLAALARFDEATAELAALAATNPTYPLLAAAELRVRLMIAVRRGDLALARTIAVQRTLDLPVTYEDELLADLSCLTGEERPAAPEVERLREELSADASIRYWLAAVWPEAERALGEAAMRASVAGRAREAETFELDGPGEVAARGRLAT